MATFKIKIPATSANLGLGFDSMGVAVDLFLTIEAKKAEQWVFHYASQDLEELPQGEDNLVCQTAQYVARKYGQDLPGIEVWMDSEIPLAHGLGSSSSAIVAGIEIANHFLDLGLSDFDKVWIGTELEGHPDNIGPCITGGAFIGYYSDKLAYYTRRLEGISLIVTIPAYEISTEEARQALPQAYPSSQAVSQNAKNNVMLLAMWNQDYSLMGKLMMQDEFHEPYRRLLIDEYDQVRELTLQYGAYATVISGAGPTLLTLCPEDKVNGILEALKAVPDCTHKKVNVFYN